MADDFDKDYWEQHWQPRTDGAGAMAGSAANPYLARELTDLAPGTALDAGCGAGAEAIWLASHGWQVTAADISATALAHAARRASEAGVEVTWVEADLGTWTPASSYELVTTHYAHPAIPQLDFYDRIGGWVAPGGTLLVVGHADGHEHGHGHGHGHGGEPPAEARVTADAVAQRLARNGFDVVTAEETQRTTANGGVLHDVVVRVLRTH